MIGMRMGQEEAFDLVGLAALREILRMGRLKQDISLMGRPAIDGVDAAGGYQPEKGGGAGDLTQRSVEFQMNRHDGVLGQTAG
ncbi:MAG: hypothetical protein JW395_2885 [Nitrospira sp.]|nr:hypothetical protein [Nitrospira sp.]